MTKAILYTNTNGKKAAMSVTLDGMADGETEAEYLTRMIGVFVPEASRASAEVVDREAADAAVGAEREPAPDPVDVLLANSAVAALVAAINDGSLPIGQSLPPAELRECIRAKISR